MSPPPLPLILSPTRLHPALAVALALALAVVLAMCGPPIIGGPM